MWANASSLVSRCVSECTKMCLRWFDGQMQVDDSDTTKIVQLYNIALNVRLCSVQTCFYAPYVRPLRVAMASSIISRCWVHFIESSHQIIPNRLPERLLKKCICTTLSRRHSLEMVPLFTSQALSLKVEKVL